MEDDISESDLLTRSLDLPLYSPQWNKSPYSPANHRPESERSSLIGPNIDHYNLPLFEPNLDFESMMNFHL